MRGLRSAGDAVFGITIVVPVYSGSGRSRNRKGGAGRGPPTGRGFGGSDTSKVRIVTGRGTRSFGYVRGLFSPRGVAPPTVLVVVPRQRRFADVEATIRRGGEGRGGLARSGGGTRVLLDVTFKHVFDFIEGIARPAVFDL